MANLNAWQKLTRVIPGKPFGDGTSDSTVSSDTTYSATNKSCSGASGQKNLVIASSAFTDGDILFIRQARGTGVGQWEFNKVASGGGTTTLVMSENLNYTYTDSGASQAQVTKIEMYKNVTLEAGKNWTAPAWDGNIGGDMIVVAKETPTIAGNIILTGKGFLGAAQTEGTYDTGDQGEGSAADRGTQTSSANANGGGGGVGEVGKDGGGGGGGGHGLVGSNGEGNGTCSTGGTGGTIAGSADLVTLLFGGGGGGGGRAPRAGSLGGNGGGVLVIIGKTPVITGSIITGGNVGHAGDGTVGGGGGGAGGAILVICGTGVLGDNLITAPGGITGSNPDPVGAGDGGVGAVGRIAVHHSGTVTGTTNPTFTDVTDSTLVEAAGFFAIL